MAEAEGELEDAGPENALEGDRLSSGDASEDEVKDEVEPCRKRCGRDHALVLEECRRKYVELVKSELGLLQLRERLQHFVDDKMSQSRKLADLRLHRCQVQLLRSAVEDGDRALSQEQAQLSSVRSEIADVSAALRPRTLGLLRKQHSTMKAREWRRALRGDLCSKQCELHTARASCVREASQYLYPMEVEPVTVDDEGEKSLAPSLPVVDLNEDVELDGDWVLSGQTKLPSPRIRINETALPVNGDYTEYHGTVPSASAPQINPAVEISAGLAHVAQFTWLLSKVLDTPLPHPMKQEKIICNYGRADLSRRKFHKLVSHLDDNIMYLCMAQAVPSTALSQKGTISNLWCLVTHQEVGRSGPFVCYPELFSTYNRVSTSFTDAEFDSAPPTSFSVSPSDSYANKDEESGSGEESTDWEAVQHLSSLEHHDADMLSLQQEFFGDGSRVGGSLQSSVWPQPPTHAPPNTERSSAREGGVLAMVTSGLWTSMSKFWSRPS